MRYFNFLYLLLPAVLTFCADASFNDIKTPIPLKSPIPLHNHFATYIHSEFDSLGNAVSKGDTLKLEVTRILNEFRYIWNGNEGIVFIYKESKDSRAGVYITAHIGQTDTILDSTDQYLWLQCPPRTKYPYTLNTPFSTPPLPTMSIVSRDSTHHSLEDKQDVLTPLYRCIVYEYNDVNSGIRSVSFYQEDKGLIAEYSFKDNTLYRALILVRFSLTP